MNITFNGEQAPNGMVTLTEVPNVLRIQEAQDGDKATITLAFEGNLQSTVTANSQYSITLFGDTITNVINPQQNINKNFYISSDEDSTAMNVARALRNCASVQAEWNVLHNGPDVRLIAKTIGSKWSSNDFFTTNIPNDKLTITYTQGTSTSTLYNSKIDVDVFLGNSSDANNYVTTLEKNFYGDECNFNMSPLLATISQYGCSLPYTMEMQLIKDNGEWQYLGSISANTVIGYECNMSNKLLNSNNIIQILENRFRNNEEITFYTYSNKVDYSILRGTEGWSTFLSLKNSANQEIWSYNYTNRNFGSNLLLDRTYTFPESAFTQAFYVDITEGADTIRYEVIKPLKMTEGNQRVYWRNEYGAIQFFDFTAERTEQDSSDISTYEKNVFDYHDTDAFELKKIYKNDYEKTVTLTSHLMKKSGKYVFNSLMKSKKVWTIINNKTFYIIPKSIEINEHESQNDIYTAKLQYIYSNI